jgi:hypothetical protein
MQCARCGGQGGANAFVNRGEDISKHTYEWCKCLTCGGSGVVTDEQARRIERGQAMRDKRVADGITLMEASRRLGVGPAQLSAIERGDGPAAAYLDA